MKMDSSYRSRIHFDLQLPNDIEIYLPSTALGIPIRTTTNFFVCLTLEH